MPPPYSSKLFLNNFKYQSNVIHLKYPSLKGFANVIKGEDEELMPRAQTISDQKQGLCLITPLSHLSIYTDFIYATALKVKSQTC